MKHLRSYRIWRAMIDRCRNPNNTSAKHYHALDITYDPAWAVFENFFKDMGECPANMELDRKDNNAGYSVTNCRFITHRDNLRNSGTTTLNTEKVRLIKGLLRSIKSGTPARTAHRLIGELFSVSYKTIEGISKGRNWSDIA